MIEMSSLMRNGTYMDWKVMMRDHLPDESESRFRAL
jgi:hypothetical protein